MTQPTFPSAKFMGRSYDATAVDEWIAANYPPPEKELASNSWLSVESDPTDSPAEGQGNDSGVNELIAALRDKELDEGWVHTALTDQIEALEVSRSALRAAAAEAREERAEAQKSVINVEKENRELLEENDHLREQLAEAQEAIRARESEVEQVQATAEEQAQNAAEVEALEGQSDDQSSAEILALRTALAEAESALAETEDALAETEDALAEAREELNQRDDREEVVPVVVDTPIDPVTRSVEIITQAEKVASEHIAEAEKRRAAIEAEADQRKAALTTEVEEHRAYLADSVADLEARQDNMFGELGDLIRDAKAFIESTEVQLQERRASMPQDRLTVEQ